MANSPALAWTVSMTMPPPPISCPSPELVQAKLRIQERHRKQGARAQAQSPLGSFAISSHLRWQTLSRLEHAGSSSVSPPVCRPAGKRWREGGGKVSPRRVQRSSPVDSPLTFTKACPTFMLAPHSSAKAPDTVRRQLKLAYLASLVHRSSDHKRHTTPPPLADRNEPVSPSGVSKVGPVSMMPAARDEDGCSLPHADEKSAIVSLLSRQLACMDTVPRNRSPRGSEASPSMSASSLHWSRGAVRRSSVTPLTASPLRHSSQHGATSSTAGQQGELDHQSS